MHKLTIGFLQTHTIMEQRHINLIQAVGKAYDIDISVSTYTDLAAMLKDADTLEIVMAHRLAPELLNRAHKMKWFHAMSAGVNTVVPLLKNTDVLLTNSSGVHPINIAEHVFGMMLVHARQLDLAFLNQKKKEWMRIRKELREVHGTTILILGYGAIGEQIGKLGKAFGMKVIGMKRTKTKAPYADAIITGAELDRYLPDADYVVIALPATPNTVHFFGKRLLDLMKQDSVLVNIGRGDVVDEKEMIETLKTGKITALLDVFEEEPLPADSPLWNMENVFITAHYSGATPHYMDRAIAIFCENLKAYLEKKPMPNLVDKELGY